MWSDLLLPLHGAGPARAEPKTAMSTQAAVGVTTPVSPQWQFGADLRYTNTDAIAPVPSLNYPGRPPPATFGAWACS